MSVNQYHGFLKRESPRNSEYLEECAKIINDHEIEIDEDKILDLLQITKRFPEAAIKVLNHCGLMSDQFFDAHKFLIYERWKKLYDYGFTTLINNVLDLTADLRSLDQKILPLKGSYTNANFYLSKGTMSRRPSFDLHNHDYDVIVKPIYGKSIWVVGNEEFELSPDTIVIIPAFTDHCVVSSPEKRLSLTINLTK